MIYRKILTLTDNLFLYREFKKIVEKLDIHGVSFYYRYSPNNFTIKPEQDFCPIDVKLDYKAIIANFDLVLSLHCKQLFPKELIEKVKCINIHPGYNPCNRGWFPQVFSIINKKTLGVTIHEIDEKVDHGPIIEQGEVPVYEWDTSLTAYDRVINKEVELIERNLLRIIQGEYVAEPMIHEGNINLKNDFDSLCELNLKERASIGQIIDRLRALTHGDYNNCYFKDQAGNKIYVTIGLRPE